MFKGNNLGNFKILKNALGSDCYTIGNYIKLVKIINNGQLNF